MSLTAEEHCTLGRRQPLTPQGNEAAKKNYQDAIDTDPNYMPAYAEFSYVFVREYQNAWGEANGVSRQQSLARAQQLADQGVGLGNDPKSGWRNDFRGLWYRAMVSWNQGDFKRGFDEYEAARRLIQARALRDEADLDADMAEAFTYYGQPERALELVEGAMGRNKDFRHWYLWIRSRALYALERYQEAIDTISQIAEPYNDLRLITAASLAQLAKTDPTRQPEATQVMKDFMAEDPDWTVQKSVDYPYGNDAARDHWIEGLRLAGLREK
jgi:hypothetical protein